jgi:spore coat protein U-like protein
MKPVLEDISCDRPLDMKEAIAIHRRWKISCVLFAVLGGTAFSAGAACTFRTAPGAITFTAFDPSVASTQTASTTTRVNCTAGGSPTWGFTGSNGSSPLRMKHTTQSVFIPYSISATYVSGAANNQLFTITATVLGPNYQNAQVGSYSDLLTLTITP